MLCGRCDQRLENPNDGSIREIECPDCGFFTDSVWFDEGTGVLDALQVLHCKCCTGPVTDETSPICKRCHRPYALGYDLRLSTLDDEVLAQRRLDGAAQDDDEKDSDYEDSEKEEERGSRSISSGQSSAESDLLLLDELEDAETLERQQRQKALRAASRAQRARLDVDDDEAPTARRAKIRVRIESRPDLAKKSVAVAVASSSSRSSSSKGVRKRAPHRCMGQEGSTWREAGVEDGEERERHIAELAAKYNFDHVWCKDSMKAMMQYAMLRQDARIGSENTSNGSVRKDSNASTYPKWFGQIWDPPDKLQTGRGGRQEEVTHDFKGCRFEGEFDTATECTRANRHRAVEYNLRIAETEARRAGANGGTLWANMSEKAQRSHVKKILGNHMKGFDKFVECREWWLANRDAEKKRIAARASQGEEEEEYEEEYEEEDEEEYEEEEVSRLPCSY